jgi:hypothetical protein
MQGRILNLRLTILYRSGAYPMTTSQKSMLRAWQRMMMDGTLTTVKTVAVNGKKMVDWKKIVNRKMVIWKMMIWKLVNWMMNWMMANWMMGNWMMANWMMANWMMMNWQKMVNSRYGRNGHQKASNRIRHFHCTALYRLLTHLPLAIPPPPKIPPPVLPFSKVLLMLLELSMYEHPSSPRESVGHQHNAKVLIQEPGMTKQIQGRAKCIRR